MEESRTEPFENHSALEIAEQLTMLDHLVFKVIPYEEFFGQGWMKNDKNERTPYIMKTTKHFNVISNRIASEILQWDDVNIRSAVIEKWVAVVDICRCLHNYNAVLEITSSLNRSSIFRLKRTWLKVSKQDLTPEAPVRRSSLRRPAAPKRLCYSPVITENSKKKKPKSPIEKNAEKKQVKDEDDTENSVVEPTSNGYGGLSEYELKRLENIKQNQAFLSSINLLQATEDLKRSTRRKCSQKGAEHLKIQPLTLMVLKVEVRQLLDFVL
ncbi:ral guanine nucleotide dissociation stimulator-like 1 [Nothobranchius furzeri]|uniref:ral guanine nucleotide dissociation stimulator-like 1 n=1 Tax=Nothobranchius furzeri TaxID=105023 RepID=UPI0039047265